MVTTSDTPFVDSQLTDQKKKDIKLNLASISKVQADKVADPLPNA